MGQLAKWGAVAGAGEAMQENAINKREERLVDIDQMRRERLDKWKVKQQTVRQEDAQKHQLDLVDKQTGVAREDAETQMDFKESESQKDRDSREKIAGMNLAGRGSNAPEWMKQRYKPTKQAIKDEFGATVEETMGMSDIKSGITYVLKDSVWQVPNSEMKITPSEVHPEALTRLSEKYQENPMEMYNFLQVHGWLPLWVFEGQDSHVGESQQ